LISHDAVVEASLRIIDREGLDAFSLPRLARELNVQTPSLYYHFRDRADILRTVARAIVLQSRVPAPDACRTWVDWFTGISLSFRRAVLSHRNAAPILLEFMPRDVLIWNYELGVQILAAVGVPPEARIGVIDGLDTLTLGASLAEAARSPARAGQVFANVDADAEPMLADALAANTRTAEQLFADSIRSFLRGAVPGVPPDVPAPRALIARYRDTRAAAASHDGLDGSGLPAARPPGEDEGVAGRKGGVQDPADSSDLSVGGADRLAGVFPCGDDVGIVIGGKDVEGLDPVAEVGSESSQVITPGSGTGRVSSEMTLVSRMITRQTPLPAAAHCVPATRYPCLRVPRTARECGCRALVRIPVSRSAPGRIALTSDSIERP
jgi:AcrR family transcriptional regulator